MYIPSRICEKEQRSTKFGTNGSFCCTWEREVPICSTWEHKVPIYLGKMEQWFLL